MPSWNWNEEQASSGVVHQSTTNTDHNDATILKQGYDYANFSEIGPTPVACWPLHEDSGSTAYDLAGTNDGTVNGAALGQTGLLGTSAYSFDGTDDYVDVSDSSALDITNSISVLAWVYRNDNSDNDMVCSKRDSFNSNLPYEIACPASNATEFRIHDGSQNQRLTGDPTPTGTWELIAGTFDGSTMRIYQDAVETGSTSRSNSIPTNNQPFRIGNRPGNAEYFAGRITDVRIYDHALTQSEIQTLYDVVRAQGTWTGTQKTL